MEGEIEWVNGKGGGRTFYSPDLFLLRSKLYLVTGHGVANLSWRLGVILWVSLACMWWWWCICLNITTLRERKCSCVFVCGRRWLWCFISQFIASVVIYLQHVTTQQWRKCSWVCFWSLSERRPSVHASLCLSFRFLWSSILRSSSVMARVKSDFIAVFVFLDYVLWRVNGGRRFKFLLCGSFVFLSLIHFLFAFVFLSFSFGVSTKLQASYLYELQNE